MSNVLFLGFAHSGKTVLMGVLSRYFQTMGGGHFGLNPKNSAANRFMTVIPAMLAKGEWPAQTTQHSEVCKWDVLCEKQVVTSIEMADFPGEAYRALFDTNMSPEEVEAAKHTSSALFEVISRSDKIFLLVNLADIKELTTDVREADLPWILSESLEYLKNLPTNPKITILLSQADRYFKDPTTVDARKEFLKAHSLFQNRSFDTFDVVAVSAVGNVKRDNEGREIPDLQNEFPINIKPLIHRILAGTSLMARLETLKQEVQACLTLNYRRIEKEKSQYIRSTLEGISRLNETLPKTVEIFSLLLSEDFLKQIDRARDTLPKTISMLENLLQQALKREAEELRRKREAEERMRKLAEEDARKRREAEERARKLAEEQARKKREEEARWQRLYKLWADVTSALVKLHEQFDLINAENSIICDGHLVTYLSQLKSAYEVVIARLNVPDIQEALAAIADPEKRAQFPNIETLLFAKRRIEEAKIIETKLNTFLPAYNVALKGTLEQRAQACYWEKLLKLTPYPAIHNLINKTHQKAVKKLRLQKSTKVSIVILIVLAFLEAIFFATRAYLEKKHEKEARERQEELRHQAMILKNEAERRAWQEEYDDLANNATTSSDVSELIRWLRNTGHLELIPQWEEEIERLKQQEWEAEYKNRSNNVTSSEDVEDIIRWLWANSHYELISQWEEKAKLLKQQEWEAEYVYLSANATSIIAIDELIGWLRETGHSELIPQWEEKAKPLRQQEWEAEYAYLSANATSIIAIDELIDWLRETGHSELIPQWEEKAKLLKQQEWEKEYFYLSENATSIIAIEELIEWLRETEHIELIPQWAKKKETLEIKEDLTRLRHLSYERLMELFKSEKLTSKTRAEILNAYTYKAVKEKRLNFSAAEKNYKKAIALGSDVAICNYGELLWNAGKKEDAYHQFIIASEKNIGRATYMLGCYYEEKAIDALLWETNEYEKAYEYYVRAKQQGYHDSKAINRTYKFLNQ